MKSIPKQSIYLTLIHFLHFSWIVLLWRSLNADAGIQLNAVLLICWGGAFFAELISWKKIGSEIMEIDGPYSFARAIEKANEKFLKISWYLMPPIPSHQFTKDIADEWKNGRFETTVGQMFAKFWLTSKMSLVQLLIIVPLLCFHIFSGTPVTFGGAFRSFPVSAVLAFFSFALLGKILSIYCYSFAVYIKKSHI